MPPVLGKVWLLISMALSVAFIWAMTLVYPDRYYRASFGIMATTLAFSSRHSVRPGNAAALLRTHIARVPIYWQ